MKGPAGLLHGASAAATSDGVEIPHLKVRKVGDGYLLVLEGGDSSGELYTMAGRGCARKLPRDSNPAAREGAMHEVRNDNEGGR